MSGGIEGGGGGRGIYDALKNGQIQGEASRLRAAASLLESSFYQELFKAMRDTVPDSGLLSGGSSEDMFTSMLDQSVADSAAARAERGLSEALYRQLTGSGGGMDGDGAPAAQEAGPLASEEDVES